jgi:phosphoribosylamine--glycine ligase
LRILVIGSGGREHALVWKLAQSPLAEQLFAAPGNAGTARIATNLDIAVTDVPALVKATRDNRIDLAVVGPEAALEVGVVDEFHKAGIPIFGPTQAAARIETSKVFSKTLMKKYAIPCGRSVVFTDYTAAKSYVEQQKPPIVVIADGLAAGKGVVIAPTVADAVKALTDMMVSKTFGAAGDRVLVEEFLVGREMSAFSFTDGRTVVPMAPACDYKRVNDNDEGPNTGGMGCYSPPAFYTGALGKTVQTKVMDPTVRALAAEGSPYQGILYGGLMIDGQSVKTLEFNARFGDPEAQVILPRLKTDLVDIMMGVVEGKLDKVKIEIRPEACVAVVIASGGYPGRYQTGLPISGLDDVDKDVTVFHAGTKPGPKGEVLTSGGRVLAVSALGKTLEDARKKAYANVPRIKFAGCHYRTDIAKIEAR